VARPAPRRHQPWRLHTLIRSGLPVRTIAARLGTTVRYVRLAAARQRTPLIMASGTAQASGKPGPDQLRAFIGQLSAQLLPSE
jgi:hypothetical protein